MDKTVEPMTDDAELAKVLEGMQDSTAVPAPAPAPGGLSFESTPQVATVADPTVVLPATPAPLDTPVAPALAPVVAPTAAADPALDAIKKDALSELRPLVDKLDLPADEKFDTLLLIIRSTDDKTLVQSAYDAAKGITDESKRAEALLDVVKEIDYFSNPAAGQPEL
jgi:hypothetical protein